MNGLRCYKALAACVIVEALETIEVGCRRGAGEGERARMRQARWWIDAADNRDVFSFAACCELLDLDPAHGREYAALLAEGRASFARERKALEAAWRRWPAHRPHEARPAEGALMLTEGERARADEILSGEVRPWHQSRPQAKGKTEGAEAPAVAEF